MSPVASRIWDKAYLPYKSGDLSIEDAGGKAWDELSVFLVANTRKSELVLFSEMAKVPVTEGDDMASAPAMRVIVPAFVVSELKTVVPDGLPALPALPGDRPRGVERAALDGHVHVAAR